MPAAGGTYGAPRIHAELADAGVAVDRKRGRAGDAPRARRTSRRRGPRTTRRDVQVRPARRTGSKGSVASRLTSPNACGSPTSPTFRAWRASSLGHRPRRVAAGGSSADGGAPATGSPAGPVEAWRCARGGPAGRPVHHSDQVLVHRAYSAPDREWDGWRCRWAVGDCFDNAMAESFFATLECELLARTTLSTHAEARAAIFEFIEGWYNTRRRHSALSYRRRWSSNGSMRQALWLPSPWTPFRAHELLEPGSRRRLASSAFVETPEAMMAQAHDSPSFARRIAVARPAVVDKHERGSAGPPRSTPLARTWPVGTGGRYRRPVLTRCSRRREAVDSCQIRRGCVVCWTTTGCGSAARALREDPRLTASGSGGSCALAGPVSQRTACRYVTVM